MTTSNPVRTTIRPSVHAIQEAVFDQLASYGVQVYPNGTGGPADRGLADQAHARARQAAAAGTLSWRQLVMADMAEAFAQTDPARLRDELVHTLGVATVWVEALDREVDAR